MRRGGGSDTEGGRHRKRDSDHEARGRLRDGVNVCVYACVREREEKERKMREQMGTVRQGEDSDTEKTILSPSYHLWLSLSSSSLCPPE